MTIDYKLIGKEARTLGEAIGISIVYLGIGVLIYHGCTGRLPGEAENDKAVTEQKMYENHINVLEIPLQ